MPLGPDKAPRYLQTLTHEQMAWVEAQPGARTEVVRGLVAAAMAGGLQDVDAIAKDALVAALVLLAERGSWMRGSPGELLQDLRAGESTALEFVDDVLAEMAKG